MVTTSSLNHSTGCWPVARSDGLTQMDTRSVQPAQALSGRWSSTMQVQVGLLNMGNTCYINSVLACLAGVPILGNLLRNEPSAALHRGSVCPITAPSKCVACLLSRQLLALLSDQPRTIKPIHIVTNLPLVSKSFQRGRQEDSHEFYHCLLDAAERDTKKGLKKGLLTMVEQLFQGRSISQVRCLSCGYESNTYEAFCSLSLDIGKAANIQNSLELYSAAEYLEGANKYKCDKCRALVRAKKQVAIWDEPNVLTIHVKRFNASPFSLSGAKVGRHVQFPPQLDLEPFSAAHLLGCSGTNGVGGGDRRALCARYELVGVVVHQGGSVHSGHYFAYVRDSAGRWSCVNDETVYPVSLQHVLEQQAYLLLYARCEVKQPRLPPPQQEPQQQAGGAAVTNNAGGVAAPTVFGPQLPLGVLAVKRSRSLQDDLDDYDSGERVMGPSPGPLRQGRQGSITVVQPASTRTVVLPAKLPAKPLQQQQEQGMRPAANQAPAGSGSTKPPARQAPGEGASPSTPAVSSSNGHAMPMLARASETAYEPPSKRLGHDRSAEEGQPPRPPPLLPLDTLAACDWTSRRQKIKMCLLEQLRVSSFGDAARSRFTSLFEDRLANVAPTERQDCLDSLLVELTQVGREPGTEVKAQLRRQLPVLQPDLLAWAQNGVGMLKQPPDAGHAL